MNKDFLARFGITEYHYEDPNGAYHYNVENEYHTDGDKFVLGAKKDGMYLDNATWLLVEDKGKKEKTFYSLINSESELKKILGIFSETVEDVNSKADKREEARKAVILSRLKGLRGKKVSSIEELKKFVNNYRNIIEGRAGYYKSSAEELEAFIKKGCTIHFEEYDNRVDFYLLSNDEKLIVMEGMV